MSQKRPTYTGTPYLVGAFLTLIILAVPIVLAVCESPSPDQPVVLPTPTIPPATLLPTPGPTITSVVVVGPAPPTGIPMPPPILVPTVMATATLAPPTVAPAATATAVPTATRAPTPTAIFKPAPVQIPRQP